MFWFHLCYNKEDYHSMAEVIRGDYHSMAEVIRGEQTDSGR